MDTIRMDTCGTFICGGATTDALIGVTKATCDVKI